MPLRICFPLIPARSKNFYFVRIKTHRNANVANEFICRNMDSIRSRVAQHK